MYVILNQKNIKSNSDEMWLAHIIESIRFWEMKVSFSLALSTVQCVTLVCQVYKRCTLQKNCAAV